MRTVAPRRLAAVDYRGEVSWLLGDDGFAFESVESEVLIFMCKDYTLRHTLVIVLVLGSFAGIYGGDRQIDERLSAVQLQQDLDFLFEQLEDVHPNVCAYISEERYAMIQAYLRNVCNQPLTLGQLYRQLKFALDHLEEGHITVSRPLADTPSEQEKAYQAQLKGLRAIRGVSQNSYKLLEDPSACFLRYNSCGTPHELSQYDEFFGRMFDEIRDKNVQDLIIDLRRNGGGFSGTSDLLIRYFANEPFRQYENLAKRLTPQVISFYEAVGIDYMQYLHRAYDTRPLAVDSSGMPTEAEFTVQARFVDPVEEPLRYRGRVWVLIGRNTYSSAMLFASTVQHYGLATLIGEETLAFYRRHYGDVVFISLPQSKLALQVSTALFTAHTASSVGKKKGSGIVPDHAVRQEGSDTDNAVDTVEAFVLSMIERAQRKSGRGH